MDKQQSQDLLDHVKEIRASVASIVSFIYVSIFTVTVSFVVFLFAPTIKAFLAPLMERVSRLF